jgi:Bacterial Ig-like domain
MGRRLAALALAVTAGCSRPTETQPYPGGCAPFAPVSWDPAPQAEGVPRNTAIRIAFNDYPDPDTLGAAAMLLWSGVYWHTGAYSVELVDKTVAFRPANPLRANLGYTVALLPGLRSLSGCATENQTRSFSTGGEIGAAPTADAPTFAAIQPILARSCAGEGCHRQPEEAGGGCLPAPAGGLSLCDDEAWNALVGVPSRQVSRLLLVAARDSARSYLMRKLLPGASPDVPVPTTLGHRDPPGSPLPDPDIRLIGAWIDAGALR